ncbi:hypothetical protein K2173_001546 [Erythroxylum novogranatense]|uniref:Dof zinc finger protein n=1 Tax=Erythroxylum novogranatense TaxID=1862640 RepID=A0AAV8T5B4_9ROSI|nr:hypothetical protein K2173_001546 [Erythroxylum novogranatense]
MQQQGRGVSNEMNQNEDRRLKPMQGDNQQQPQHPQQKCPRCDSLNTKFCYYNNYSLTQPRYFCKTCRRYWTQGGTLRNVPVGGGCRKGKRSKTASRKSSPSSSAENSRSQLQQPPQNVPHNLGTTPPNIIVWSTANTDNTVSAGLSKDLGNLVSPSGVTSMGTYYPSGDYLASLAAMQSLNSQPSPSFSHQPVNQSINLTVDLGSSLNQGPFHAFNAVPSYGSSQHQIQQQRQFYEGGNKDAKNEEHGFYAREEGLIQSGRPLTSSHLHNWHQQGGYMSTSNPTVSDTALWTLSATSNTSTIGKINKSNNTASASTSLNPDHDWHNLRGDGHPP